jgi:tetratricopeptide (TPR) repeat protein
MTCRGAIAARMMPPFNGFRRSGGGERPPRCRRRSMTRERIGDASIHALRSGDVVALSPAGRGAADARVAEAIRLHREGRRDDAERAYLDALAVAPGHRAALANLGVLCAERGDVDKALAIFRQCVARDPGDAHATLNLGRMLLVAERVGEALPMLERAVALAPRSAEAHNALGIARKRAGDRDGAIGAFERALDVRPEFIEALSNLVDALLEGNRHDDALAATERMLERAPGHAGATFKKAYVLALIGEFDEAQALTLDVLRIHPDHAPAYNNLGAIASWRNDLAAAIGHFEEALRRDPGLVDAEIGLAHALLARGDYASGWQHYEARPWGLRRLSARTGLPGRVWTGETLAQGSLLVFAEGGLGDVVQFARLAPLARARVGRLVLHLAPYFAPLAPLVATIDGIDAVTTSPDAFACSDAHVSVMSLPYLCWNDLATAPTAVPFVAVDAGRREAWRQRIPPGAALKVGIAWSGSPRPGNVEAATIDRRRSMPLATLAPLLDVPGVAWYSLQIGDAARELAASRYAARITDCAEHLADFAETGALIEQLDLVVAVDTSVLHVACALAKPAWMPNRFDSCWRWGVARADAPWYPTLRLFRQRSFGDWGPVVADLRDALSHAAAHHAARP